MNFLLIVVAVLLVVAVTTKSHFAGLGGTVDSEANAIPAVVIPSVLDQSEEVGSEVKLVLLALMPEGFDNTEMQLDSGEHLFIIGNRTGLKKSAFGSIVKERGWSPKQLWVAGKEIGRRD